MIAADAIRGDMLPVLPASAKGRLADRPHSLNYVLQDIDIDYRTGGNQNDEQ